VAEPKFVMLVRLDDPKDVQYADSSAAPLFRDIAKFILQYMEVPAERSKK
jgi:cell division protein FtsI/penicillin-binding protein 2